MAGEIAKKWLDYQARHLPDLVPGLTANAVEIATLEARRAFYGGALVAAQASGEEHRRERLIAECADFFSKLHHAEPHT